MAYAFNDDKSKFDLEETIDNVDNLIGNMAAIETSPVITNHSTGEYIMYNGTLLKVLSPIATGENLVLGTNVTPINFGDEIEAFQNSMSRQTYSISSYGNNVLNAAQYVTVVEKAGHVVHIAVPLTRNNNATIPPNGLLFTLPVECRAKADFYATARLGSNPATMAPLLINSSNGDIILKDINWSSSIMIVDLTYLV